MNEIMFACLDLYPYYQVYVPFHIFCNFQQLLWNDYYHTFMILKKYITQNTRHSCPEFDKKVSLVVDLIELQ